MGGMTNTHPLPDWNALAKLGDDELPVVAHRADYGVRATLAPEVNPLSRALLAWTAPWSASDGAVRK